MVFEFLEIDIFSPELHRILLVAFLLYRTRYKLLFAISFSVYFSTMQETAFHILYWNETRKALLKLLAYFDAR